MIDARGVQNVGLHRSRRKGVETADAFDRRAAARAAERGLEIAFCGVVPLMLTLLMLWTARGFVAIDFHNAFRPAAEAVLAGHSPYPPTTAEALGSRATFVYLPFAAFLFTPFALLPPLAADLVATAIVTALGAAALWILGIRDWRCYGVALGSMPVVSAIQTANLTLPLAFALAAVWVTRRRVYAPGVILALTLAAKLFLWPVLVWLVATRRYRAALAGAAATAAIVAASWAVLGFAGAREYPTLLRILASTLESDSYTAFALASELGAPGWAARAVGLGLAAAALGASWILGRRGDDRRSFTLATLAALMFTPIVWLHYFALLFVPIAIAHRRLSGLWVAPCAVWFFAAGFGNGTTSQTALTLGAFAAIAALALRARQRLEPRPA